MESPPSGKERSAGGGESAPIPTDPPKPAPQSDADKPAVEPHAVKVNENELDSGAKKDHSRHHAVLESLGLKVGRALGHGSYASVKLASDTKRKEDVAIKIVSRRRAPRDYLAKFLPRELEVLKLLQHPSLIKFYQVIETTNRFYIVMELAHNGDLLDAIRSRMFVHEYLSRQWFSQLYEGIVYIHAKGVAHRDIKCENLLLDSKNNIKITDFGFAKRIYPIKTTKELYSETFCGSYAYAAPEILKGVPYDPFVSEIWSMGVVLFTMVFGRLPYDDSDLRRLLKQVQNPVVLPTQPLVSDQCKGLIQKILVHQLPHRIPLGDIPRHDWFKTNLPAPAEHTDDSTPAQTAAEKGEKTTESQQSEKSHQSAKNDQSTKSDQ